MPTIEEIAKSLELQPHGNGGFFKEMYRDSHAIPHQSLPSTFADTEDSDPRSLSTAILVLLPAQTPSLLHWVRSDEMYHFHLGTSITLHEFNMETRVYTKTIMGSDVTHGHKVQHVIPRGIVWGTTVNSEKPSDYALFGATVSPGFDFRDFKHPTRAQMLELFTEQKEVIIKLTN